LEVLWGLVLIGAPTVLGTLVWNLFQAFGDVEPCASFVEYFAGRKSITTAMREHGYTCLSYERDDDAEFQDFTSAKGFCFALRCLLSLRKGGGMWAAIVCSSWVRISAGTSGRKDTGVAFQRIHRRSKAAMLSTRHR
jgi:hypothetical protein